MPAFLSRLLFTFAAFSVLVPATVSAQAWVGNSRSQGAGIRLGEFALHPGIGAEAGYDSNVFLADDAKQSSGVLRVSPHLYLVSVTPEQGELPRVTLRTGATGRMKHYFATDQGTDMGVTQELKLTINPERLFSVELFQQYDRTIDPFVDAFDDGVAGAPNGGSAGDYDRDQIGAGAKIVLSSRGGVLKGGLGYRIDMDHYEGVEFANFRNRRHTFSADTVYEFLPKTGVFWSGSVGLHRYVYDDPMAQLERNNGTLVSTRAGIKGGLTSTIAFTLAAGYGAGLFQGDGDYENVIGTAELRWKPSATVGWNLGYDREYNTAYLGNYSRLDRIRTKLDLLFGTAVVISAKGEVTFINFGESIQGLRRDTHLLLGLNGEYRVLSWLAFTAEANYLRNFSDYAFDPNNTGVGDSVEYDRFEVWGGVRAFW